jgi:acyl carrier protein
MEINTFIENFAAQFDDTDTSDFKLETRFREIDEWSSLTALSVIAMVDEEYDVKLRGEDIRNSHSINDLFLIVNSRM